MAIVTAEFVKIHTNSGFALCEFEAAPAASERAFDQLSGF